MRSLILLTVVLAGCNENKLSGRDPNLGVTDTAEIPTTATTGTPTGWTWSTTATGAGTGGGTGSGTGGGGTGPGTGTGTYTTTWSTTTTGDWDECDWALHVAGWLDNLQTPNDGRVLYCHSSGCSNWTFVDSDNSSCLTHIDHNCDVFPTTLCDS